MEPQRILMHAAEKALSDAGHELRARGWDVNLYVEHDPDTGPWGSFIVSLRYVLPSMPRPIECAPAASSDAGVRP